MINLSLFKASEYNDDGLVEHELDNISYQVQEINISARLIDQVILDESKTGAEKQFEIIEINKRIIALTQGL